MGTLWSTNPQEDVKRISINEDPVDSTVDIDDKMLEEDILPFLNEVEKKDLAAKRLDYMSKKYPKLKTPLKPKEEIAEDSRYDQYLKDIRS